MSVTFIEVFRHYSSNKLCGKIRLCSTLTSAPSLVGAQRSAQLRAMSSRATPPEATPPGSEPHSPADQPIKFSTSDAHQHRPFDTFFVKDPLPPYQPISICVSVAVFLIYFLVLREENDLDGELSRSIYERVPALHEKDLLGRIKQAELRGHDTTDLYRELNELRKSVR